MRLGRQPANDILQLDRFFASIPRFFDMFTPDQYELLDFGRGRRLERFGSVIVDRPSPAAEGFSSNDDVLWRETDAKFERTDDDQGRWRWRTAKQATWLLTHGPATLELKATDVGHLGLFPEQTENWDWLAQRISAARRPLKVLNLFAYTGGSTLAAAAAGAEVVHVDAAKNVVAWARRNAELSQLHDRPIRWIAEDASLFVRRELKRGNHYDAVILDPPSYGHGPRGETWKLSTDLAPLLVDCAELVDRAPAFFLLTCHTPGFGPAELDAMLSDTLFGRCQQGVVAKTLSITARDGRKLPCGTVARWPK